MTEFFQLLPEAPLPLAADSSLEGSMPLRAYRYCEPMLLANGAGWTIGAPIDVTLRWDGSDVHVDGRDGWQPLTEPIDWGTDEWRAHVPEHLRGVLPDAPPGVVSPSQPDRGLIQVWTGLVARTPPGVGLWVRAPVNRPRPVAYDVLEGVIETDWWFGNIVTALQFRTNETVTLSRFDPFLQLVPTRTELLLDRNAEGSFGCQHLSPADWEAIADTRRLAFDETGEARDGGYKREARRRRT